MLYSSRIYFLEWNILYLALGKNEKISQKDKIKILVYCPLLFTNNKSILFIFGDSKIQYILSKNLHIGIL
jgi:hypothetical protein